MGGMHQLLQLLGESLVPLLLGKRETLLLLLLGDGGTLLLTMEKGGSGQASVTATKGKGGAC